MLTITLTAFLAFYVAWNLGANDVANSMGTSVGSKVLTLTKALIIAGILEFAGAVLFSQGVSATLATEIVNPDLFASQPQILLLGMIAVLISCGAWLQIATSLGLPVASSHAVVGAIAGFSFVAVGKTAIDWSEIAMIFLAWIVTPVLSGLVAFGFYNLVNRGILTQPQPIKQLEEWIPWLSALLLGVFGVLVGNKIVQGAGWDWWAFPRHDLVLAMGGGAAIALTIVSWRQLDKTKHNQNQNLDSSKNGQLKAVEGEIGRLQVLSACFVAFAHGANDVGNAIAPLGVIYYIFRTNSVPLSGFTIPIWVLILGGIGIVAGLAVQGKKVINTVGEGIISLQPSSGFCAEIATATTVLLASRLGLPVSTSHALVGAVVGIGLVRNRQEIRWQTLQSVVLAWVVTLPMAAILAAISFSLLRLWFANT